jgi:plastocyanin
MRIPLFVSWALAAAAVFAGPTAADNPQLVGTVGPDFTISLTDPSGAAITHVDPGTYTLVVHDKSEFHNFHLTGPGVDVSTDVDFVGDKTFTVTLTDGGYKFVCDPHSTLMEGGFTAGTPPATPPKRKSTTKAATVTLGVAGTLAAPAKLARGKYALTIRDLSSKDNVHLVGPGVNRKTGVAFRGTARWTVTLSRGRYHVSSDAHKKLARTIVVS